MEHDRLCRRHFPCRLDQLLRAVDAVGAAGAQGVGIVKVLVGAEGIRLPRPFCVDICLVLHVASDAVPVLVRILRHESDSARCLRHRARVGLAEPGQFFPVVFENFRPGRNEVVRVPGRAAGGGPTAASHQEHRSRVAVRGRRDSDRAPLELKGLAGPGFFQERPDVVHVLLAHAEVLAHGAKLRLPITPADHGDHAPATDDVEHREILGELYRVV